MKPGMHQSEEVKRRISESMKKLPSWNDGSEKAKKRLEQVKNMGKSNKGKLQPIERINALIGDKNPNWKGGVTNWKYIKPNDRPRHTKEYKLWRKAVFERDGNKCIWCQSNIRLEADHIKPWKDYPELRFAIDNGRTLCHECHKRTDSYGFRSRYCTQ